jgi:DDE superfamily endonuclease
LIILKDLLYFSRWPEDCSKLAQQFFEAGGFPSTGGVIDGCHVNISPPKEDKNSYLNRHHSTSINVLAVAGPDLSFYYVDASAPGRWHDSKVLKESSLWHAMESGERPFAGAVLLGDSGFALRDWLITPFSGW